VTGNAPKIEKKSPDLAIRTDALRELASKWHVKYSRTYRMLLSRISTTSFAMQNLFHRARMLLCCYISLDFANK
jgi:hypothetical protein